MPSVTDLLKANARMCAECLTRRTGSRSDHVLRELDVLGCAAAEGLCSTCAEVTPVFSAR